MEETQKKERVMQNVEIKEEVGETSRAGGQWRNWKVAELCCSPAQFFSLKGGSDQPAVIESKKEEDHEKVEIVIEKKMVTVQDWLKSSREACDDEGSSTVGNINNPENNPDIPLVPKALRGKEGFRKYFEPTIISIGPYHHGKKKLKAGESRKLRWAEEFFKLLRARDINEDTLLVSVRREIKEFRACYDATHVKEDKYDDETLAWMLFVDGCSVLYYMICCLHGNFIALNLNHSDLAILQQDLILLENQLPYQVLVLLMTGMPRMFLLEPKEMIDFFVRWLITKPSGREPKRWDIISLIKRMWTSGTAATQEKKKEQPSHLLEIMQRQYVCGSRGSCDKARERKVKQREHDTRGLKEKSCSFHNVTELTAKGIRLKPLLRRYGFIDVDFHDDNPFLIPQLLLPPITIDNTTKTKLLNMVALEMSSTSKGSNVTSYICFLNSLISDKDDVKELKAAHILYNFLGSNEELAKFFKGIADNLVPEYGIYRHVFNKNEQYLERGRSSIWSWMTEATRIYLRSPWKAIAVFAGFLAISVGIVQAYFTIFPLPDKCNKSI